MRATELIEEARPLAERNISALRDEMVGLGPYAFDELTLDVALEQCAKTWARRHAVRDRDDHRAGRSLERRRGSLFGVAEAVINAGRHAEAKNVSITVRIIDSEVELRVRTTASASRATRRWARTRPATSASRACASGSS